MICAECMGWMKRSRAELLARSRAGRLVRNRAERLARIRLDQPARGGAANRSASARKRSRVPLGVPWATDRPAGHQSRRGIACLW